MALAINHGLGGPKLIPKGAGDGQLINISALLGDYPAGAKEISMCALLVWHCLRRVQRAPTEGWEFTQPTHMKSFPRKACLLCRLGSVP